MAVTDDCYEAEKTKEETSLERFRKLKEEMKRKMMRQMDQERKDKGKAEIRSLDDIL